MGVWLLATDEAAFGGALASLRAVGRSVTGIAVGSRRLAESLAESGVDRVLWAEVDTVEAAGPLLRTAAARERPALVVTPPSPGGLSLASAIASELDAALVPSAASMRVDGTDLVADQLALGGRVIVTLRAPLPVVAFYAGDDVPTERSEPAPIEVLTGEVAEIGSMTTGVLAGGVDLDSADRVVAVGRGLASRDDLSLIEDLASALGAEIACSMPVADDLGWFSRDRYIGRSGRHISPRLYLAIGISGAPQHMEGVRGAKVVAAINSDPGAPVFRACDYGVVGSLYDVIPPLIHHIKETSHD